MDFLGRQGLHGLAATLADRFAGSEELAASALGERCGTHSAETFVRGAQRLACVRTAVFHAPPLTLTQPAPREPDPPHAARESRPQRAGQSLLVLPPPPPPRPRPPAPLP